MATKAVVLCFLVVIFLGNSCNHASAWQYCEEDDIYGIYGHCGESLQRKGPKVPPSPLCCSFIADVDKMTCVCDNLITKEVEKEISMRKLVRAAKVCGAPLNPGTKCGHYTVPDE